MKLALTTSGLEFLLKSLQGGPSPEFCKIAFGNGVDAGSNATEMSNLVKELDIYSITRKEDYVSLVSILNNTEITERFKATELGVYITDPTSSTGVTLYAYGYSPEDEAALIPAASDYLIETEETIMVYVGSVEDVKAVLSDSSLYASKVVVDEMKQTVDVLAPPVYETRVDTGILPDKEYQFQSTATIIDGFYAACSTGLFASGELTSFVAAEGCSLAIIPVQSGETYTIFFPGVTSREIVLNAATLKTYKQLFLGFSVIKSNAELDINAISEDSLNMWFFEESEPLLDGYGDCTESGTANPDKFNSGYYFSFTAPEGADTLIFNVALSENANSKKVYDYKDSFLFFKGLYSELPSQETRLLYQLGKCIIKDLESRNLIDGLSLSIETISKFLTAEDISDSYIDSHIENSMVNATEIKVCKAGFIVNGRILIEGSFPEASGEDLEWTIDSSYVPTIGNMNLSVIPYSDAGAIMPSDRCSAYLSDGKIHIEPHSYDFTSVAVFINYIC